jgi:hypothetical protein
MYSHHCCKAPGQNEYRAFGARVAHHPRCTAAHCIGPCRVPSMVRRNLQCQPVKDWTPEMNAIGHMNQRLPRVRNDGGKRAPYFHAAPLHSVYSSTKAAPSVWCRDVQRQRKPVSGWTHCGTKPNRMVMAGRKGNQTFRLQPTSRLSRLNVIISMREREEHRTFDCNQRLVWGGWWRKGTRPAVFQENVLVKPVRAVDARKE